MNIFYVKFLMFGSLLCIENVLPSTVVVCVIDVANTSSSVYKSDNGLCKLYCMALYGSQDVHLAVANLFIFCFCFLLCLVADSFGLLGVAYLFVLQLFCCIFISILLLLIALHLCYICPVVSHQGHHTSATFRTVG